MPRSSPTDGRGARARLIDQLARQVPGPVGNACVLVGVDGRDGSGKTIFADALAAAVRDLDRPVVRISADDFHHVRAVRYRRGRDSPIGFWLDSYNHERLLTDVLEPLGRHGTRRYRSRAHDLATDAVLEPPWQTATPGSVVIVDGLFLHRDGLIDHWHFSVFLDVPFAVTARRMAHRDGSNPDPDHPSLRRYVDAQRIYDSECAPRARATVVIDNADLDHPFVTTQHRDGDAVDLTLHSYTVATAEYLAAGPHLSKSVRGYLDDFAALVPNGRVLELGSGPGHDADHLEAQGVRVSRTDAAEPFVQRLRAAGHDVRLLDARADDYGGPFDGVLADAVLLHLDRDQTEAALHRARRAVNADGVLGITVKEGDGSEWTTAKLGRPRRFTYWRADELTALLERTGWDVVSLRHVAGRAETWLFVLARARD